MNLRRYSTAPQSTAKGTSPAVYLGVGGLVLAAAYGYMQYSAPAVPAVPKEPLKSALDKDKWVDFKLKKVEPYNHNTAKYVMGLCYSFWMLKLRTRP